jgi:hypothetical protein
MSIASIDLISLVAFLCSQICILLSTYFLQEMIRQIQESPAAEEKFSHWLGYPGKTLKIARVHKTLYPESRLNVYRRWLEYAGLGLLAVAGWRILFR